MKKLLCLALSAALLIGLFACGAPAAIPNPPLVLGEKYLFDLDYEQALLQFDQAIRIEPKNPRGYLGKADALLHLGRQADAVSALADGAKAARGEGRAALKAAQAEVGKSSVEGYVGLSAAYERLGWRDIAVALLRRVCGEMPEEGRLREALESIAGLIEKETKAVTQSAESTATSIPVGVFTLEEAEQFGITWDTDVYKLADKFGIARSDIDQALRECKNLEDGHVTQVLTEGYGACFWFSNKGFDGMSFNERYSGPPLPHDIYVGMNAKKAFESFYSSDEITFESLTQPGQEIYRCSDPIAKCLYHAIFSMGTDWGTGEGRANGGMEFNVFQGEKGVRLKIYYDMQTMLVTHIDITIDN